MVQDDYEDYVHNLAKEHNLTPKEISILREQAQAPLGLAPALT
jgi:hypothetical protein